MLEVPAIAADAPAQSRAARGDRAAAPAATYQGGCHLGCRLLPTWLPYGATMRLPLMLLAAAASAAAAAKQQLPGSQAAAARGLIPSSRPELPDLTTCRTLPHQPRALCSHAPAPRADLDVHALEMPEDRAPPPAGGPARRAPFWTTLGGSTPYRRPPAAPEQRTWK